MEGSIWPIWGMSGPLEVLSIMGGVGFGKIYQPVGLECQIRMFYFILWKWELLNTFNKTTAGFCEKPTYVKVIYLLTMLRFFS